MAPALSLPRPNDWLVALLVLSVCLAGGAAASGLAVEGVAVDGPGVVDGEGKQPLLAAWREATVEVTVDPATAPTEVCVYANASAESATLTCEIVLDTDPQTLTTTVEEWPISESGHVTLVAVATSPEDDPSRAEQSVSLLHPDDERADALAGVTDGEPATERGPFDRRDLPDVFGRPWSERASRDEHPQHVADANASRPGERRQEVSGPVEVPLAPVTTTVPTVFAAALAFGAALGAVATILLSRVPRGRLRRVRDRIGSAAPETAPRNPPEGTDPDVQRVRRLLDAHGGRLPQSEVVARTDWSKSKVSRLLDSMAQDGRIRKVRVGRENLVVLPEATPSEEPAEE